MCEKSGGVVGIRESSIGERPRGSTLEHDPARSVPRRNVTRFKEIPSRIGSILTNPGLQVTSIHTITTLILEIYRKI
jgi:hypothetical protein